METLLLVKNCNIQEMNIPKVWRCFELPPAGYKLENEGKLVGDQSFVHKLKPGINQVIASCNSLVPMPPPSSVPPPIPPSVIKYSITAGQSFGRQVSSAQIIAYLMYILMVVHTMDLSTMIK